MEYLSLIVLQKNLRNLLTINRRKFHQQNLCRKKVKNLKNTHRKKRQLVINLNKFQKNRMTSNKSPLKFTKFKKNISNLFLSKTTKRKLFKISLLSNNNKFNSNQ